MKKREKLQIVRQFYPKAMTTIDAVNRLLVLAEDLLDLEPSQIMLADSICSDDINAMEYPRVAYEMLGPFKMGGLNGFPFTGLTGMNAFAHHVPEDGAVFIYYAPHIGITKDGTTGEVNRIGQSKPSACCGAARAALNKLMAGNITKGEVDELDYQQHRIEQIFLTQQERIQQAVDPLREATQVMYEAIDERICLLAQKTQYPCRYLILMGAILINGELNMGSFSDCQRFEVHDLETNEKKDFLPLLNP